MVKIMSEVKWTTYQPRAPFSVRLRQLLFWEKMKTRSPVKVFPRQSEKMRTTTKTNISAVEVFTLVKQKQLCNLLFITGENSTFGHFFCDLFVFSFCAPLDFLSWTLFQWSDLCCAVCSHCTVCSSLLKFKVGCSKWRSNKWTSFDHVCSGSFFTKEMTR